MRQLPQSGRNTIVGRLLHRVLVPWTCGAPWPEKVLGTHEYLSVQSQTVTTTHLAVGLDHTDVAKASVAAEQRTILRNPSKYNTVEETISGVKRDEMLHIIPFLEEMPRLMPPALCFTRTD